MGDAFTSSPNWGLGDWWAPDVIVRHGTFYLYYVGKGIAAGVHCVAVAVATAHKPTGPFTHRNIIGCGDAKGQGYIDPAPLISGNDWQHDYATGYATSSSPTGPFTKYRPAVQGPHGGWWLVYHAWPPGANMATGDQRTMRIDPLRWTGDVVSVRGPTTRPEPAP